MKSLSDPRHNARKLALSSIFCWMFNEPDTESCVNVSRELLESTETDEDLVKLLISGVETNILEIDKIIEEAAPEWPLDKISKIDLVILRIAIFEVVYGTKTPTKVAIDEAVELAKEFGNETSSKFVNGVLGTVVEKYHKEEKKEEKEQ